MWHRLAMTARTVIRDYVIWSKHLHGDLTLPARIEALEPGETIELAVDGVPGTWAKMARGKDGRTTPGIRPVGRAQAFWRELYEQRRGNEVSVRPVEDDAHLISPATSRTPEGREAAIQRLFALSGRGFMSDGTPWTRDEMNER